MNISGILKELRTEKGLTQGELASNLGITQDSISLWEKGKRLPDTQYIVRLSDFFGVSTDYLLGRSDDLGYVTVQSSPTAPLLSNEESQLLSLFRGMTHAQKVRFIAYGEGIVGIEIPKFKA